MRSLVNYAWLGCVVVVVASQSLLHPGKVYAQTGVSEPAGESLASEQIPVCGLSSVNDQQDEVALLYTALSWLVANPHRALALAIKHRQRFPFGTFSEERETILIEALWRTGRYQQARHVAVYFEIAFPGSIYRKRLARLFLEQWRRRIENVVDNSA